MKNIHDERVSMLISKTRSGEESAFSEIAQQYRPLIESCICYFHQSLPRDELEQEALISLYHAACTYDSSVNNVSFGLYAKICINNSLISLARAAAKRETQSVDMIERDEESEQDPSDDYISRESFNKLDCFVKNHLSSYEYSVFRLYIEGYRVKEIAHKLSRTEKSVDDAIMRLKIKLRSSLNRSDL